MSDIMNRTFVITGNGVQGVVPIDVTTYYSALLSFYGVSSSTTMTVEGSINGTDWEEIINGVDAYGAHALHFSVAEVNTIRLVVSNSDSVECTAILVVRAEDPGHIEDSAVFGIPETLADTSVEAKDGYGSQVLAFTDVAVSVELANDTTYRFVSTQNCFIGFLTSGQAAVTSTTGMYFLSDIPEIFSTNEHRYTISVIRATSNGNLYITKMGS